ncbi:putative polyketide synthase [Apodospora peruviana]|uniref:Polyketide synthase n=1 Tax=Apodospora peruviana TaxID=516989 RepID=A0AAE0I4F9_9PEZI|nr:putative polyketide synthase [Apodospora peruviana]
MCHGTGTKAGDPIEAKAVARVFGEDGGSGIYIGSVKPNLGHSEDNSGLSSVIKMVLALENKTIPPNINFTTPNPNIPFEKANMTVPVEPTPWPAGKAERVGVNSFGIGGANAHVGHNTALSCSSSSNHHPASLLSSNPPILIVLSAQHPDALRTSIKNHETYALDHPGSLADVSYTLGARRETLSTAPSAWRPRRARSRCRQSPSR